MEDQTYEGRRYIFLHKNELKISAPEYLRKIIMLDSARDAISYEEDYFSNPIEKKYLIISHYYYLNKTNIVLQAENRSTTLDNVQADSVLKLWNVKYNPF